MVDGLSYVGTGICFVDAADVIVPDEWAPHYRKRQSERSLSLGQKLRRNTIQKEMR